MAEHNNKGEILIYQTEDGQTKVEVAFDGETVWLSQDKMAELFQKSKSTVNEHLKNIFEEGELVESEVMIKFGNPEFNKDHKKPVYFYNLNAILAVGYRVKSHRGVQFRKWASGVLTEYMKKGFAMNDELLKNMGGGTYFKELLERIRDIRSSEKVFYRQVLDLFVTSVDYDAKNEIAIKFFKEMQNKLLYSVSENTAAELIIGRANSELPFMGLQSFKGAKPLKSEAAVAKNYLTKKEIEQLNLMVSAYLDSAELKAKRGIPMYMADWVKELTGFIEYQKMPQLAGKGNSTHEEAEKFAGEEYDKYNKKIFKELTQAERDFLTVIHQTYEILEHKKPKNKKE